MNRLPCQALALLLAPTLLMAGSRSPAELLDQALDHAYGLETATAVLWLYQSQAKGETEAAAARELIEKQLPARASFRVAVALRDGSPELPANPAEALRWFRKAHQQGETKAEIPLALMLLKTPEGKNFQEAFQILEAAAAREVVEAYTPLARCYREALGTQPDPQMASKYQRLAADSGDPEGQYLVAQELLVAGQDEAAEVWLEKAAYQGHHEAVPMVVERLRTERVKQLSELARSPAKPLASLVLYWRPRCPYCVRFDPIIQKVAKERGIPLKRVNIWEPAGRIESDVEGVSAVPITFLLDQDGRILERLRGAVPQEKLEEALDEHSEG